MSTTTCTACHHRPTHDATVCVPCGEDLARALGDVAALVTRPCHHTLPTTEQVNAGAPADRCTSCHRVPLQRDSFAALPSSPFDTPSTLARLNGSRNLGDDLDIAAAHQAAITRRDATRGAATSRTYLPDRRLDRAHARLDGALTIWANVIEAEHPNLPPTPARPHRDGTGRALGNLAGWLLHHVEWLRHHPQGHEAVEQITGAVAAVERVVDAPPEKLYLGPCWQPDDTAPSGECTADLYHYVEPLPGQPPRTTVRCPACLHEHPIEERRDWLQAHMYEAVATATEVSRAAHILGLEVTPERIRQWKARGRILTRGTRQIGKKAHPLYRVGDILHLATVELDTRRKGRSA